jgi:hypothetical protein
LSRLRILGALAFSVLAFAACDQSFEPIQKSDRYFSVYGMLDASADTQWIRVMPVRDSAFTGPGPIDAVVTLENVVTGKIVTLEDRPMRYRAADANVVDDLFAHNFWTVEPIEYEATYVFAVTRSDGRQSSALIRIPKRIASVTVGVLQPPQGGFGGDYVRIADPTFIAFAEVIHHGQMGPGGIITLCECVQYQSMGSVHADGSWRLGDLKRWLDKDFAPLNRCLGARDLKCEIVIISTGDPWPFDPLRTEGALKGINATSNITNGVGFVGGIARKTVPFEDCLKKVLLSPVLNQRIYCEITYDANSASIGGWVRDRCRGIPIDNPKVIFNEVDGEYLRIFDADYTGGAYSIGGLIPGRAYSYEISAADYDSQVGTMTFEAGEHVETGFQLSHKTRACS